MVASNTFAEVKEQVAAKVRKLLTQAEDPAATPEEAEAFSEKAQQLMSRYSISLSMVADAKRPDELTSRMIHIKGAHGRRKAALANAVARANDCRAVSIQTGKQYSLDIVGYSADVEWVQTLYTSLEVQLASSLKRDAKNRSADVNGRTWTVNYIAGFTSSVAKRLNAAKASAIAAEQERVDTERRELIEAALEDETPTAAPSVALVLVEKAAKVDDEFKIRHPKTRTVYTRARYSPSGHSAGAAAGNKANLAKGTVSGRRSLVA